MKKMPSDIRKRLIEKNYKELIDIYVQVIKSAKLTSDFEDGSSFPIEAYQVIVACCLIIPYKTDNLDQLSKLLKDTFLNQLETVAVNNTVIQKIRDKQELKDKINKL